MKNPTFQIAYFLLYSLNVSVNYNVDLKLSRNLDGILWPDSEGQFAKIIAS